MHVVGEIADEGVVVAAVDVGSDSGSGSVVRSDWEIEDEDLDEGEVADVDEGGRSEGNE